MAGFYDSRILEALRNAPKPMRHRDLVAAIAPNEYSAYSNIGISLTKLHRDGLLDREKCDGRYWYYSIATEPRVDDRLNALRNERIDLLARRVQDLRAENVRLRAALTLVMAAADNGEWHASLDCEDEERDDDCFLCVALRSARAALGEE